MNTINSQWTIIVAVVVVALIALATWLSYRQKQSRDFGIGSVRNTAKRSMTLEVR